MDIATQNVLSTFSFIFKHLKTFLMQIQCILNLQHLQFQSALKNIVLTQTPSLSNANFLFHNVKESLKLLDPFLYPDQHKKLMGSILGQGPTTIRTGNLRGVTYFDAVVEHILHNHIHVVN